MKENVEPLVNDGFAGDAAKRCLIYIQTQAGKGKNVVGIYCGYAPMEVICAADIVPLEK
jgi:benzoyl-CoA reductase/2-hydroxyglutaryl-CoA dehydratase subunit BcrC/BadD/HgdB